MSNLKDPRNFWGPCTWKTIHNFAVAYKPSKENALAFKSFIESLIYLLPCKACRDHLKENLKKFSLDKYLSSNTQLFLWTYLLHDMVNRQIGKKSPNFLDIRKIYFSGLGVECSGCDI